MLFFPVGETVSTTSTLFPQRLQRRARPLAPDLAATLVVEFAFPDMKLSSFHIFRVIMRRLTIFPFTFDMRTIPL